MSTTTNILSCSKLVLRHMPACELNSNEIDSLDNLGAEMCLYCILMINLIFISEVHISQAQSTRLRLTGFDHTSDRRKTLYHPTKPRIPKTYQQGYRHNAFRVMGIREGRHCDIQRRIVSDRARSSAKSPLP